MATYQADRLRLGRQLTEAEQKLRDLQAELDRTPATAPGFSETRWLLERQRETCRLARAEIERLENRRNNAVNREVIGLLRDSEPTLYARLMSQAQRQVDPEGAA